jgi:hypothetical protein
MAISISTNECDDYRHKLKLENIFTLIICSNKISPYENHDTVC